MAIVALALLALAVVAAAYDAIDDFPSALIVVARIALAAVIAWAGLLRTDPVRAICLVIAAVLLAVSLFAIASEGVVFGDIAAIVCFVATAGAARLAFAVHTTLPRAEPAARPVLFVNPRSGGGKAERFGLVDAARSRGYETVEAS